MVNLLGQHGDPGPVTSADCVSGPDFDLGRHLEEHRSVARRALRAVLGACQDEEDLVQEVTVRLLRRLKQPGEFDVPAWTWRVAHNVAVDHIRKRRAVPVSDTRLDRGVGDGLDDEVIAGQLESAVRSAMERLPHRQRDALLASAALDGGRGRHSLVAARLGVSDKAAESLLARARVALRKELLAAGGLAVLVAGVSLLRRALRRRAVVGIVLAALAVTAMFDMRAIPVVGEGRPPRQRVGALGPPRTAPSRQGQSPVQAATRRVSPATVLSPVAVPAGLSETSAPPVSTSTGPSPTEPATSSLLSGSPGLPPPIPPLPTQRVTAPTLPSVTLPPLPMTLPPLPALTVPPLPPATVPTLTSMPTGSVSTVVNNITSTLPGPIAPALRRS